MPHLFSVRALQAMMGFAYLALAAAAILRSFTPLALVLAVAMMIGAYFTGRTVPDFQIRSDQLLRVCGVGLFMIVAGTAADVAGGPHALGWASVVMAYCAGNRLRAAGIGPAA